MSTDLHVTPTAPLLLSDVSVLPEEEKQSLQSTGRTLREQVASVVILSTEEYQRCGAWTLDIVAARKKIADRLDAGVKSAYDAYKFVYDLRAELDAPVAEAEKTLSRKLSAFQAAERAREQELIRRQREEEKAKARAEQERLEAVRRERDRAERERLRREQEDRFVEEAAKREREGDQESAQLILAAATELPPPEPKPQPPARQVSAKPVVLQSAVPKLDGIAFRTDWKWAMSCGHAAQLDPECDNCKLVPREYLMLKETAINGTVRALKERTRIGGIDVFSEENSSKSRKGLPGK